MRVMHLETGMHLYGGAAQVRYLIRGLNAEGVDNVLVCPAGSAIAGAAAARRVIEIPVAGDFDVRLFNRLRTVIDEVRPDIVHAHSRRGADWFGGRAAASCGVAAVITRRVDNPEPGFIARLKYRPYRAVIAISRAIEALLVGQVGLAASKVHRIASAVDAAGHRPGAREKLLAALDLPGETFIVGVVAQLIPRKGHDILLKALPTLVNRHPGLRAVFFGRGPQEERLRERIAESGLSEHVRLAGFREDLPELMPGLDVLVHPVRAEGLGVAVLEGLSAGVPVVATAVGGIVDVIEPAVHGLLVPPDDPAALAAAVERLMDDGAFGARLAAAGRERVEKHFSVGRMTAGHLAVYRSLS